MKNSFYLFSIILCFTLFGTTKSFSQVSVVSSDTVDCTHLTTVLTATLEGDTPTDAGITSDDVYSNPIPIGFTFSFYGINYTSVVIGANGTLDFNLADAGAYDPWPISAPLLGNSSKFNNICGPWCDIDIFYTGATIGTETYSTDGVAPNRKFAVTWCACSMFSCGTQLTTTQVILYEGTNICEVHIAKKPVCAGWNGGYAIVGVQNATGTAATTAPGRDFPSVWTIPPTEAWRFTPVGGTSYTVASIPYAPIPYASSLIYWYDITAGTYLGTGMTMTVTPTSGHLYRAAALGCADTSSAYYFVTASGGISITTTSVNPTTTTSVNPVTCGPCNGSITLSGLTPGAIDTVHYTYNSTTEPVIIATVSPTGTIVLNNLCAGTYVLSVSHGDCTSLPHTVVLTNPPIPISGTPTNPTSCGACNGTITITGLFPSITYTVTYTLGGTAQPPMVLSTSSTASSVTMTGLCAGTYDNIIVHFGSGCVTSATGPYVLTNPAISMTGTSANNSYCGVCDGTITLNGLYASTAFIINYSLGGVAQPPVTLTSNTSGTIVLTGLCAGTYTNITATIASSGGVCVTPAIGPFTITAPPPPALNVTGSVNPSQCGYCDGSITIKAIAPFSTDTVSYSVNGTPATATVIAHADSAIVINGLCAGSYTGFSVKVGQCIYTVNGSATLTTIPIVAVNDTAVKFGCNGDTVSFSNASTTAPGASLFYIWHFGDGTSDTSATPTHVFPQGTYTVTMIATNHVCADSIKKTLTLIHPLLASFIDSPSIICQGELVTFNNTTTVTVSNNATPATSAGYYQWDFGNGATQTTQNGSYTFQNTGTYTVTLTAQDWVPCQSVASAIVQVDTISKINIRLTDTVICQGTYVTYTGLYAGLGNTGNFWNFGDGTTMANMNPIVHGFNDPGNFTISVTADYRACPTITTSRSVLVVPQPYINLGADTAICKGSESIILKDVINGVSNTAGWVWNNGQTTPSIVVTEPGYYYATVNVGNCYASDTVWVKNDCYMNLPNVFTPNNDGSNDYFFPRDLLTKGLIQFSMNIYNRWGQRVFETATLDGRGWDGKLNGVDQPEGVFVYIIDAMFKDGQKEHHQGNVTLLR